MMKQLVALGALILALGLSDAAFAAGPGQCGKGKIWDDNAQRCVPKPRSGGSALPF